MDFILMRKHKQTTMKIDGVTITVDAGVRKLIRQFHELPGVETYHSCQGHRGATDAYVHFGGPGACQLLVPLAQMILSEHWTTCQNRPVCRGSFGRSVRLEVTGTGMVLRWDPKDYRRLLLMIANLRKSFPVGHE